MNRDYKTGDRCGRVFPSGQACPGRWFIRTSAKISPGVRRQYLRCDCCGDSTTRDTDESRIRKRRRQLPDAETAALY